MMNFFQLFQLVSSLFMVAGSVTAGADSLHMTPARPPLPIAVDNSVWQVLENSPSYKNAFKTRGVRLDVEWSELTKPTDNKNDIQQTKPPIKKQVQTQIAPLGDKCYVNTTTTRSVMPSIKTSAAVQTTYVCGLMVVMGSTSDGKPQIGIANLQMTGGLLPPQIGATQSVRYTVLWLADAKYNMDVDATCKISEKVRATNLSARLKGAAWVMQCKTNEVFEGKSKTYETEDYLLEDLGLLASDIGVIDMNAQRAIVPVAGTTTISDVPGDPSVQTTIIYDRYDVKLTN